ncbi:nickel-dependent lactate racemase, partial [Candidatus Aerophobetes bacterium]|nr:nickel-dependent lactate racemase [Candidatus Aerophobetes bacterium]
VTKLDNPKTKILDSIRNPIASPPLLKLVDLAQKVVIIADDNTRLTPVRVIIPVLLDELNRGGIRDDQIKVIIGGGSHRLMTKEEIKEKFGQEILSRVQVIPHEYANKDKLLDFGTTKRGTRVWINKEVIEADLRIGVGSIVPHLPAGWAGGAKIVLPGVAGKESVDQLHLLGVSDPQIKLGMVETSFRKEIEEFAEKIGLHFIVNSIYDKDGDLVNIVAGHFKEAHRKGVEFARDVYELECKEFADITISSTYPVDYDFFQADKGIFSAVLATKQGGEVILVSPCYEGVSPSHEVQFGKMMGMRSSKIINECRKGCVEDIMGASEIVMINSMRKRCNITLVTEGLKKDQVEKMGCKYIEPSLFSNYLEEKLKKRPDYKVGIIHQSALVFPKVVSKGETNV